MTRVADVATAGCKRAICAGADIGAPHLGAMPDHILRSPKAGVKSVRAVLCIVLLAGVHQLTGCAGSLVGMQSDGTYLLERNEEQGTCDALYKSIWGRIQLI